jgi:hypothetical protein
MKQNKTKQNKTKQNKTKQNKTKQNKIKQNKKLFLVSFIGYYKLPDVHEQQWHTLERLNF